MLIMSWQLTIVCFVTLPLGFSLMGMLIPKMQKYYNLRFKSLGNLSGVVEETYGSSTIIKAFNQEQKVLNTFNKQNEDLYKYSFWSSVASGMFGPIMRFTSYLGTAGVLIVAVALSASNPVHWMALIPSFLIFINQLQGPLANIAQHLDQLQQCGTAGERIFGILNEKEISNNPTKHVDPSKVKGLVEFKNVKSGYTPDKIIIKDLSPLAKPGMKIAIVGPTGAGKQPL